MLRGWWRKRGRLGGGVAGQDGRWKALPDDFDRVERHNLDRLLHTSGRNIGELKVVTLSRAIIESATADGFRSLP